MSRAAALCVVFVLSLACAQPVIAQWDPVGGSWGKSEETDLRVMTYNLFNGICSTNVKQEGFNNWSALARVVATLRPDVLIMQEAGDNSGNGTGSGVDSVADLTTTMRLFFEGGFDPFRQEQVTAYVQKYAPGYDLPHVFVSNVTDGWNRNVILSKHPFADLNGDTFSTYSNFSMLPDAYAPGGTGGIRGFQVAQIDLPDGVYAGNLTVGNSHLKAGGSTSDRQARLTAAQNIAYFIDYYFNGARTGQPDPNGVIFLGPNPDSILDENTPVVWGGDWNEDELTNGRRGPAAWMTQAELPGGGDGTDRDGSDSVYDDARDPFTSSRATFGTTTKLDYIAWQDSIADLRRAFILNSSTIVPNGGVYPPQFDGFDFPNVVTGLASDHRPLVVDLILPLADQCPPDWNGDGVVDSDDLFDFLSDWAAGDADYNGDGVTDSDDLFEFLSDWAAGC